MTFFFFFSHVWPSRLQPCHPANSLPLILAPNCGTGFVKWAGSWWEVTIQLVCHGGTHLTPLEEALAELCSGKVTQTQTPPANWHQRSEGWRMDMSVTVCASKWKYSNYCGLLLHPPGFDWILPLGSGWWCLYLGGDLVSLSAMAGVPDALTQLQSLFYCSGSCGDLWEVII